MGRPSAPTVAGHHPDIDDRWSLFVSAISGEPVALAAANDLYTDGRTVFYNSNNSSPDGLAVQAALLSIGSFSAASIAKLVARPQIRRKYLLLESLRAATELAGVLPPRTVRRIQSSSDHQAPSSSEESLAFASRNGRAVEDAPDWMGVIKPTSLVRTTLVAPGRRPGRNDKPENATDTHEQDENDDAPESKLLKLLQAPGASRNPIAQYLQKLLGIRRSSNGGSASGGDEMTADGHRAAALRGPFSHMVLADTEGPPMLFAPAPTGRRYPEWDYLRQVNRPDRCLVTEFDPDVTEERFNTSVDLRLRRELARIGIAPERHRRQDEGDALDLDAVIDRCVERRVSGQVGDDRIYERRLNTAHDLGVLLLLDATGSTGESEDGKRIFDEQRSVLAALASEFDALGVRVAAYAFRSFGRQNVQFLRIKRYDDRHNAAVERRLEGVEPGGFTRIGAAIRHGTHIARRESGATTDLMVVIGDGLPYDDGYEGRYAREDSRRALADAVDAGVAVACLSIRTATDEATLKETWGSVNYAVLDDPDDLARGAAYLFKSALKTAAASRRRI